LAIGDIGWTCAAARHVAKHLTAWTLTIGVSAGGTFYKSSAIARNWIFSGCQILTRAIGRRTAIHTLTRRNAGWIRASNTDWIKYRSPRTIVYACVIRTVAREKARAIVCNRIVRGIRRGWIVNCSALTFRSFWILGTIARGHIVVEIAKLGQRIEYKSVLATLVCCEWITALQIGRAVPSWYRVTSNTKIQTLARGRVCICTLAAGNIVRRITLASQWVKHLENGTRDNGCNTLVTLRVCGTIPREYKVAIAIGTPTIRRTNCDSGNDKRC